MTAAAAGIAMLALVASASSGRATSAAAVACPKGTVTAVIAGKRACLKAGQACRPKYQAQYSRYGFDCINRRLRKQNVRIRVVGPEVVVYDFEGDTCAPGNDLVDGGVRAFRDASGQVQMIMPSFDSNRRMIGPDLDHLAHDCTVTLPSNQNPDPAAYDNGNWLASVYTLDGSTIYGLTHMEYVGAIFPGMCPVGQDTPDWIRCWWNTIQLVVSTDGGRSYRRASKRNGLVGALPYRYDPSGIGFEGMGLGGITQIVRNPADGYYYTISGDVIAPPRGAGPGGHCLMRTKNLGDPTSWRGWDGRDFVVTFVDPYREPAEPPSAYLCSYLKLPGGSVNLSLSWNTFLNRWLIAYQWVGGGWWFTTSPDLIRWSAPRKFVDRKSAWDAKCGDTSMLGYGSVIDPASTSRNFETTGRRPYFFYNLSQLAWPNCTRVITGTQLVRVQLEITK
jgi:hypothetical protein